VSVWSPLLRGLGLLYSGGVWIDRLRKESVILNKPVVSVGNIALGGRSKTPFVIELCRGLKERGFEPLVLTRGYGRKNRHPVWNIPDRLHVELPKGAKKVVTHQADAEDSGDEAVEIFLRCDVPVLVGANRVQQARDFIKNAPPLRWVFVLDDGFQHWRLERDFDLVLIHEDDLSGKVFPEGRLRESPDSLDRADLVLCRDKDFRKNTKLLAFPPHGNAIGVLTTRAQRDFEYLETFQEQYENLKILELPDHASRERIVQALLKGGALHWVLGLKEASKLFKWEELGAFYKKGHASISKGRLKDYQFYCADFTLELKDASVLWPKLIEKLKVRELLP
jgi:tetraacyldisaccharide 4'-kinase